MPLRLAPRGKSLALPLRRSPGADQIRSGSSAKKQPKEPPPCGYAPNGRHQAFAQAKLTAYPLVGVDGIPTGWYFRSPWQLISGLFADICKGTRLASSLSVLPTIHGRKYEYA